MISLYLFGYYQVRICTSCMEQILYACRKDKITLYALCLDGSAYAFKIERKNLRALVAIFDKYKIADYECKPVGAFFYFQKYRKRYAFILGACMFLGLLLYSERFVWNINIKGNYSISDEMLLDYLDSRNITVGTLKNSIICEEEELQLREYFHNVSWVSMAFEGTTLQLEIKEAHDRLYRGIEGCSDIRANEEGTVVSMITRKGVPCVSVGDEVFVNDILISGQVPVYNENQEIIAYQSYAADGDITIETIKPYYDFQPFLYEIREETKDNHILYLVICGEKIPLTGYKMNTQSYFVSQFHGLSIHDTFMLGLERTTQTQYLYRYNRYTQEEAVRILEHNFQKYILCLQEIGVQIIEKNVKIMIYRHGIALEGEIKILKDTGERVDIS